MSDGVLWRELGQIGQIALVGRCWGSKRVKGVVLYLSGCGIVHRLTTFTWVEW